MPPAELTYNIENLRKIEYMDFLRKKANLSGKVAGYVLEELSDQLNYSRVLTGSLAKNE